MQNLIILHLLLLSLLSCSLERCTDEKSSIDLAAPTKVNQETSSRTVSKKNNPSVLTTDTVLIINNTNYQVAFTADVSQYEETDFNACLTIKNLKTGDTLLSDSLSSSYPRLTFADFNGDKRLDILLYRGSGSRANDYNYLYVTSVEKDRFVRVEGFEYLCNAQITAQNIITSYCLSGENTSSRFRISPKNKLERLDSGTENLSTNGNSNSLLDTLLQMCRLNTTDTFNMERLQTDDFSTMIPVPEKWYLTLFPNRSDYSKNTFFIYARLPSQGEYLPLILYQKNYESENIRVDHVYLINIDSTGECLDKIRLAARDLEVIAYEINSVLRLNTLKITETWSSEPYFGSVPDTLYTDYYTLKLNDINRVDTVEVSRSFEIY